MIVFILSSLRTTSVLFIALLWVWAIDDVLGEETFSYKSVSGFGMVPMTIVLYLTYYGI